MTKFVMHDSGTAPTGSRELLSNAKKSLGFVPNLFAVMAESPATLESYMTQGKIFGSSNLDPVEQQVVLLSVSRTNGCEYCVSAHSVIADMTGMTEPVLDAIRNGSTIPEERLDALSKFAVTVVEKRGWLDSSDIEDVMTAGFDRGQILDVLAGVSMKILSNYVNHIAETPLDDAFVARKWTAGS